MEVGIATLLALAVNFTIAALWYHPRPFELGIGHQLIEHAVATSFPSDHGTILFTVAVSLMAFANLRVWAWLALGAASAVAWARVWLGIHWPLDMLGSFAVALGAVWIIGRARQTSAMQHLTSLGLDLADRLLDLLHVPPNWVKRSGCDR